MMMQPSMQQLESQVDRWVDGFADELKGLRSYGDPGVPGIGKRIPKIGFGEITSKGLEARGLGNLRGRIFDQALNPRLGYTGHGALVTYDRKGQVILNILDPTLTRVVNSGRVGTLPSDLLRDPQANAGEIERRIRMQIRRRTGQSLRGQRDPSHPGPDLLPRSPARSNRSRRGSSLAALMRLGLGLVSPRSRTRTRRSFDAFLDSDLGGQRGIEEDLIVGDWAD